MKAIIHQNSHHLPDTQVDDCLLFEMPFTLMLASSNRHRRLNKAVVLEHKGDINQALDLYRLALETQEQVLGPAHPLVKETIGISPTTPARLSTNPLQTLIFALVC